MLPSLVERFREGETDFLASDNERPTCGFCRLLGAACIYPDKGASTFDPASLCILDRLAVIESSLRNIDRVVSTHSAHPTTRSTPGDYPSAELLAGNSSPSWTSKSFLSSSRVNTDSVLAWPVFQKALSEVPKWTFLDQHGEIVSSHLRVSSPRQLNPGPANSQQQLGLLHFSIDWESLQPFLDQYFRRANNKNPVLDRLDVQQLYEIICERGPAWDCSTCLVLIVCALGVLAPDWTYRKPETTALAAQSLPRVPGALKELRMADRFYQAARELLGLALITSDLRSIQCLCLAGIYHMYRLDCVTAIRMFHVAGNALQTFLSTMETEMASALERDEIDAMQRLLWTCAKSERELLAEVPIGTLAITHFKQFERYPQPPQTPSFGNTEDNWQSVQEDSWYYYLAEIALRRIADDIIGTLYPAEQERDYHGAGYPIEDLIPIAQEFVRQLEGWHQSLPGPISFPLSPEELQSEVRYFSRSRYFLVSEMLHRPFLCYVIHNSTATVNTEVLAFANKGLCFARDYLLASNHGHRHHGKWLQLRRELTASCLLLAASESGLEMPTEWYRGVERGRHNFQQWMEELPSLASFTQILDAVDNSAHQTVKSPLEASSKVRTPHE